MTPDLDAIKARLAAPINFESCPDGPDRFEFWTNEAGAGLFTHAQDDLAALLAELRATTSDLAVAVEVARERGEALADLRAGIEALRDEWWERADAAFAAYPNPIGTRDGFPRGYASAQSVHADALDALLRGA